MTSVSIETELDPNNTCEVNIQCNIEHIQCNIEQPKTDGDENLETKSDEKPVEKVNIAYLIKVKLNIQVTMEVQVFPLRQR